MWPLSAGALERGELAGNVPLDGKRGVGDVLLDLAHCAEQRCFVDGVDCRLPSFRDQGHHGRHGRETDLEADVRGDLAGGLEFLELGERRECIVVVVCFEGAGLAQCFDDLVDLGFCRWWGCDGVEVVVVLAQDLGKCREVIALECAEVVAFACLAVGDAL